MDLSHFHDKSIEHCFCQLPLADLKKWAYSKFVEQKSTAELLGMAKTDYERELVSIVAMLDVAPDKLDEMLHHKTSPGCNLEKCRDGVRNWLQVICEKKHNAL